jgi:hypothetical protein
MLLFCVLKKIISGSCMCLNYLRHCVGGLLVDFSCMSIVRPIGYVSPCDSFIVSEMERQYVSYEYC